MAVYKELDCVGCVGRLACKIPPERCHTVVFECDKCGYEFENGELYRFDGKDYCAECLLEVLLEKQVIRRSGLEEG